jgi:DDE superfamily endonuclease
LSRWYYPGSIHDSKVAEEGKLYHKLIEVYEACNGRCTADSAFAAGRYPCLTKSTQWIKKRNMSDEEYNYRVEVNKEATSMRQSAEWGVQALQGSFPRLTDHFIYEEKGEWRLIVQTCLLLYNLRAQKVGINQIKNLYLPNLEVGVVTTSSSVLPM